MARENCRNGAPYEECGKWYGGRKALCEKCEEEAVQRYPQGWRGYPGDTCKHGVYTGGCGIDWMCSRCEYGDDE